MREHLYTLALILASAGSTVTANVSLKLAAQGHGIGTVWPLSILNTRALVAAGAFAMAFIFYTMILRRLPLSLAQAIIAIQFILVILAANVLLSEPIGAVRWIGIGLMAIGLLVIGLSPDVRS